MSKTEVIGRRTQSFRTGLQLDSARQSNASLVRQTCGKWSHEGTGLTHTLGDADVSACTHIGVRTVQGTFKDLCAFLKWRVGYTDAGFLACGLSKLHATCIPGYIAAIGVFLTDTIRTQRNRA